MTSERGERVKKGSLTPIITYPVEERLLMNDFPFFCFVFFPGFGMAWFQVRIRALMSFSSTDRCNCLTQSNERYRTPAVCCKGGRLV